MNNEIRLEGRMSPEVSIKGICLCADKNCVHTRSINIVFDVIAEVSFDDLPELIKQIHELDGIGWEEVEKRNWEVIIREKKAENDKEGR